MIPEQSSQLATGASGSKRSAERMESGQGSEERPSKVADIVTGPDGMELTICFAASGSFMTKVCVPSGSGERVADLKSRLEKSGNVVKELFHGDIPLQDSQPLETCGLSDGGQLKAIVVGKLTAFADLSFVCAEVQEA